MSGTDPALSDGSVGSAPSLGLSPGPPCSTESNRSQDKNKQKGQMMSEGVDDEGLEERVIVYSRGSFRDQMEFVQIHCLVVVEFV